ncbi:hypothetical protein ACIBM3_15510 [Rhodococcus erythropolis]|uniref:hypothetical protein n=1 Tax=Rhodococcus erythropolis TaxID=1833 RepID=UPI0037979BCE
MSRSSAAGQEKSLIPHLKVTLQAFDGGYSIKHYQTNAAVITVKLSWAFIANDVIRTVDCACEVSTLGRHHRGLRDAVD